MVAWWWILVALFVGAFIGLLTISLCVAAGRAPDDISRRIDNPPGFDSIRPGMVNQCILCGAEMPGGDHVCTECVRAADERKDNSRKVKSMIIDGIEVTVQGDEALPGEVEGYVRRGIKENGTRLTGMVVMLDGADVDIEYILRNPFERIRRITGYLQKTVQWNSAKLAEEHNRVKHDT